MIKVEVKGETEFGLPKDYTEIKIPESDIGSVMDHFGVDPKIRKHLYPVVNNKMGKGNTELKEGDRIILQSPYSGG
jgi:molybdopterin converting factor small subunit